jgi:flagellar biogenesis protein FliO
VSIAAASSHVSSTVPDISIGHAFFQMVIALAVIGACAWGGTKLLARLRGGNGARTRSAATNGLTVLSRQPLGKGLQIAVVRWGEREVLVGISGTTITFLSDPRVEEPQTAAVDPGFSPVATGADGFGPGSFAAGFGAPRAAGFTMPVPATTTTPRHAAPSPSARRPFLESLRDATSRR